MDGWMAFFFVMLIVWLMLDGTCLLLLSERRRSNERLSMHTGTGSYRTFVWAKQYTV